MKNDTIQSSIRAKAVKKLHELRNLQPADFEGKQFISMLADGYKAEKIEIDGVEYRFEAEHHLKWGGVEWYHVFIHNGEEGTIDDELVGALTVSETGFIRWDGVPMTDEKLMEMPTYVWESYVDQELRSQIRPRQLYIAAVQKWYDGKCNGEREAKILRMLCA